MEILPARDDQVRSLLAKIAELRGDNNRLKGLLEKEKARTAVFVDNASGIIQNSENKTTPKYVVKWMIEYGMPWQVFWCDDHNQWHTELDTCFPYHMEQSECDWCKKGR